jgi:endonuclease YncB( thermonuclease family)
VRLWGIVIAISGLVGIVLAGLAARQHLVSEQPATISMPASGGSVGRGFEPQTLSEPPGRQENVNVRGIAPAIVAVPPVETEALERIPPRPPLSEVGLAAPPPGIAESVRIFRPVATAAGRIQAAGYTVAISGIAVTEPDKTCDGEDGGTWPCGMLARTAFRNFLRLRAIECTLPSGPPTGTVTADCMVGKQDIGAWLVTQGWALAAESGPYTKAQEAAKSQHLGLHGSGLP